MTQTLPLRPSIERYEAQARELLQACNAGDPKAQARLGAPPASAAPGSAPSLADAQLAIAREHGLPSWARFEQGVGAVRALGEALHGGGDAARVESLVGEAPEIVNSWPWPDLEVTPIQIVASMCVWHQPQMHAIAQILAARGARQSLQIAARAGLIEQVRIFLESEPQSLNVKDPRGGTPLYYAACVSGAFEEGLEVAKFLIERGAEVDIFVAATCALVERVEVLLSADSSLAQARDPYGNTALHWSVRPRQGRSSDLPSMEVTRRLLAAGAQIAAANPSDDGMQAIHHACEWPVCNDHIALLLEAGADINARTAGGWTPLDFAIDRGRQETAAFLKGHGAER